jgi:predicted TIM-barrel fold metal-dependent hydrolase
MWKLDRDWKGLRNEVPWLVKPPSEYLLDHIRFTTQPFIEPHEQRHVAPLMEMLHADRTLMFSSDYPHWDFDNPQRSLQAVSKELRHKIMVETPRAVYGDRLD